MSNHKYARRVPDIGYVAMRMLSIPAMAFALLVTYVSLRSSLDAPAQLAEVATAQHATAVVAHETDVAGKEFAVAPARRDTADMAHVTLDPMAAGRSPAP